MNTKVWGKLKRPRHFVVGKTYRWPHNDGAWGDAERKCIEVLPDDMERPGENMGRFEGYGDSVLYATGQFEVMEEGIWGRITQLVRGLFR